MSNYEGITWDMAKHYLLYGVFNNNWRQRRVEVRKHPTDPTKVVSVGHPFDNSEPIVCVESRDHYIPQLDGDDWRDYN